MNRKVVAVIGAGPSGLSAIKSCREEGMDVVCFEKTDSFGGIWNYREAHVDGVGSIMKSRVSNFSKEMNAFSDFPPPWDAPNFMHHRAMMEYLSAYVDHFDLARHILFCEDVVEISQTDNHEKTGRWVVKSTNLESSDGVIVERTFDAVMVCTGRRGYPHQPLFPGQDDFKGKIMHSKYVKTVAEFEDKNVLIIGFGNSAVEAAVDISPVAKQVYLSTRSGNWVVPKASPKGMPTDYLFLRRHIHILQKVGYGNVCGRVQKFLESKFSHEDYRIRPSHDPLSKGPVISDDLPDKILTGRVLIKDDVAMFHSDGVVFKDEDSVTGIDIVIFATGYRVELSFLDSRFWTNSRREFLKLYKYVFPVASQHPTLAIIGLVDPLGPSIPICESQARWASLVFSGKVKLPGEDTMTDDIRTKTNLLQERFPKSSKLSPEVNYIKYMDELANLCGCQVNMPLLCIKDFTLFWQCFTGPCLPYQYRLFGPHSWCQAREAMETHEDRIAQPLRVGQNPTTSKSVHWREKFSNSKYTYGGALVTIGLVLMM